MAHIVSKVQAQSAPEFWGHVQTSENPATREIHTSDLLTSHLQWNGPSFLLEPGLTPKLSEPYSTTDLEELSAHSKLIAVETTGEKDLLSHYSNISTLVKVTAFVLRFVENAKTGKNSTSIAKALIPTLKTTETSNALL